MISSLSAPKYNNVVNTLDGYGLTSSQADDARAPNMRAKFISIVDSVNANDADALNTAHRYVVEKLGEATVAKILAEIDQDLPGAVARLSRSFGTVGTTASSAVELARAFENVASLANRGSQANRTASDKLREQHLELTTVAYADGNRTFGVWGDDIADVRLNAYKPDVRRYRGSEPETLGCPFVKDTNWAGPFGVMDLAAFSVKTKGGRVVSLQDVIDNPSKYVNDWNGPEASFYSASKDEISRREKTGPKVAVMDALVPAADGHTETVPTIKTYGKTKLVLIAVPGEGISAHYTDGSGTVKLPIIENGREKALQVTRQQFSDRQEPTSFDRGASAADDMLINTAVIIQIPVRNPDAPRPTLRRGPVLFGGPAVLESFGVTRGGGAKGIAASLDSGNYGTEAGVVSAGMDLGAQKRIPPRIYRDEAKPIRIDFVLYAATDSQVISDALARRMRQDMDNVVNNPACEKVRSEN
jgi:hypothetical protein